MAAALRSSGQHRTPSQAWSAWLAAYSRYGSCWEVCSPSCREPCVLHCDRGHWRSQHIQYRGCTVLTHRPQKTACTATFARSAVSCFRSLSRWHRNAAVPAPGTAGQGAVGLFTSMLPHCCTGSVIPASGNREMWIAAHDVTPLGRLSSIGCCTAYGRSASQRSPCLWRRRHLPSLRYHPPSHLSLLLYGSDLATSSKGICLVFVFAVRQMHMRTGLRCRAMCTGVGDAAVGRCESAAQHVQRLHDGSSGACGV